MVKFSKKSGLLVGPEGPNPTFARPEGLPCYRITGFSKQEIQVTGTNAYNAAERICAALNRDYRLKLKKRGRKNV